MAVAEVAAEDLLVVLAEEGSRPELVRGPAHFGRCPRIGKFSCLGVLNLNEEVTGLVLWPLDNVFSCGRETVGYDFTW